MTFYNQIVDKGRLKKLISGAFRIHGSARCSQLADDLKDLGFRFATKAGVSISIEDLTIPPSKKEMLESAEKEIRTTESRYARGEITEVERFQKVIDTWNSTSEELKDEVVRNFRETDPLNSVYMMAFSGARGNMSQVRQLVGMRGLMADPQGEIIDLPIKTNFREGLTVTEYIISSYGARKGLVDTALRTADSGYLTRRLVDVSQDVIVREVDCGTDRDVKVTAMIEGDQVKIPLVDRLVGRLLARDIVVDGEVLGTRNQQIDDDLAIKLSKAVDEIYVRSPLTCEAARSVCQSCYGWSLGHGHLVDLGEAVGIIAAQSIGEPGTQLTMRTFHTGGVFTGEVARQVKDFGKGTVKWGPGLITRKVRTRHGEDAEQVEVAGDLIWKGEGKKAETKAIPLTPGSLVFVQNGDSVEANQLLTEVSLSKAQRSTERATKDVSSDLAGEVMFANLVPEEKTDRQGNTTRIAQRGGLVWVLSGEVYNLPPGAEAVVKNGDEVKRGSVMAETKVVSVNGGIVRLEDGSREIEIITASVLLDQAQVKLESGGGREQYVIYAADGKRFLLKTSPGTKVQNHAIIAELIDDRYRTNTGGMIRHAGVEIAKGSRKQGYEITKGGTLLWIPEETHEINKDISLLIVEDGQYVEAGTEVVKDIFCQSNGVVEVVQKNDILREIIIKPGEFHLDVDPDAVNVEAGQLVQPGTEVLPGVLVTELRQAEWIESTEGLGLLLRPVEEYPISDEPATLSQGSQNSQGGRQIELRSVQRLYYKDGERVKSVEGSQLLSTQLVLEFTGAENDSVTHLAADIELQDDEENDCKRLQLVILESLVLRRDVETDPHSGTTQTRVLVKDGQHIPAGEVLARTEIQCKEAGIVRGIKDGDEAVRRVLLVRETDRSIIDTQGKIPTVKPGDLLVAGSEIAPGVILEESGAVLRVSEPKAWEVVLDNLNQQYIEPFSRQLNSLIGFLNVEQFNLSFFGVQDTPSEKQALKKLEETEKNIRDKFINSYGEYGALYFKLRLAGKLEPAETLKLQEEKSKLPSGLEQTLIDTLDQLDQAKQEIDWSLSHRVQIRTARPYRVSGGAVLHVDDGDLVQRGDNLVLLVFERAKTGDIIQGLPRIEELLEARKPKEACVLARKPGVCQVEYQDRESVDIKIIEDDGTISEYPLLPGQNAIVADEQRVNVGDPLTDGLANPHEILDVFFSYYVENKGCYEAALMGLQAAQKFLVNQVQTVYQSQGVDISDKHIEVIVRQMTSKVRIDDGGDTTMLPGELIELRQVEQVNEAMSITGAAPARYTPVILGITKASLNTDSFISAASFQETTRVLTEAAIEGKSDWLRGLKENVIIGRLIPAGTGFNTHEDIQIANNESDDISYGRSSPERYNLTEVRTPIAEPARKTKTRSRILAKDLSSDEDMVLDDKIAREFTEEYGALQEDEDDFEESYGEDDFEEDDD